MALALAGCSSGGGGADRSATPAPSSSASSGDQRPEILSIPSIKFSSGLKPEGLRGGKVNPDPGQVIWFTGSKRVTPGSKGTAVVAGHVADGAKPDVFADLVKVRQGTRFALTLADGRTLSYKVVRAAVVDKEKLSHDQQVWGPNPNKSRVVLITCDGDLGRRSDGHRKANYVVVGEMS